MVTIIGIDVAHEVRSAGARVVVAGLVEGERAEGECGVAVEVGAETEAQRVLGEGRARADRREVESFVASAGAVVLEDPPGLLARIPSREQRQDEEGRREVVALDDRREVVRLALEAEGRVGHLLVVLEGELRHADELDAACRRARDGDRREAVGRFDLAHVATGDVVTGRLAVPHHDDARRRSARRSRSSRGATWRSRRTRRRRQPGALGEVEERRPRIVRGAEQR